MKKIFPIMLAFALVSFVVFIAAIGSTVSNPSRTILIVPGYDDVFHKKILFPTVRVSNLDITEKGSGVVIRSEKVGDVYHNVVLTCFHCVTDPDGFYYIDLPIYENDVFVNWDRHPALVYSGSSEHDIAVLLFKTNSQLYVADILFSCKAFIGTKLVHVGCGLGDQPRLDVGSITSLNSFVRPHSQAVYRTNMHVIPGDSGGPAFFENGLIGLIQAVKYTTFQGIPTLLPNISFCIPIDSLKIWDVNQNQTLRFIYNNQVSLPVLPYAEMEYFPIDWNNTKHEEGK